MSSDGKARQLRWISHRLLILTALAAVVLLVCPLLFWWFEHTRSPDVGGVGSAFQWLFRTLLESASPYKVRTGGGFVIYYTVRIAGVSLVALATGTVASRLVSHVLIEGRHMGSTDAKDHVVVCGWSSKAPEIVRELRAEEVEDKRAIVVLANLEQNPLRDIDAEFLRGDPTDEVDLRRAGVDRAETAIVLTDESGVTQTDGDRDARTLLTVLAVEALNPTCYTCVEVVRRENRQHFLRTNADELVISAELTGALLAGSAKTHGLSRVVGDLVTHPDGNEFYRVPTPAALVDQTVSDAMTWCKQHLDAVLVGLAPAGAGAPMQLNPPGGQRIASSDELFIIASAPVRASLSRR